MTWAPVLFCLVVGISDGDTLTARCSAAPADPPRRTFVVRLAQIDAPERGQPFSAQSRQALSRLCRRAQAQVRPTTPPDRYGRTVARVVCNGTDANAAQVRAGMAWVYDRHASDADLYRLQADAREARRGLWADPRPVAPWHWRKAPRQDRPAR